MEMEKIEVKGKVRLRYSSIPSISTRLPLRRDIWASNPVRIIKGRAERGNIRL